MLFIVSMTDRHFECPGWLHVRWVMRRPNLVACIVSRVWPCCCWLHVLSLKGSHTFTSVHKQTNTHDIRSFTPIFCSLTCVFSPPCCLWKAWRRSLASKAASLTFWSFLLFNSFQVTYSLLSNKLTVTSSECRRTVHATWRVTGVFFQLVRGEPHCGIQENHLYLTSDSPGWCQTWQTTGKVSYMLSGSVQCVHWAQTGSDLFEFYYSNYNDFSMCHHLTQCFVKSLECGHSFWLQYYSFYLVA